jgi:hypothetical protein
MLRFVAGVMSALLLVSLPRPIAAQRAAVAAERPVIQAVYVPQGLSVDGRLDEPIYSSVTASGGFIQQEPEEGKPATEKTDVWVFFDDKNLYIAARMWDSHPERMIANEMRRDAGTDIVNNENFSVIVDTFHDQRSGFYFMTNMLGALRDASFVSERQSNSEWNPIWNPRSARFEQGWTTEIEIPFKSLRYTGEGEQTWGIQFRRGVRWKNEVSYFTRVPASVGAFAVYRMADAATLTGLRTPAAGKNLEIKPYASSRISTDTVVRPAISNEVDGDVGVDVKYGMTQALTADFTYNTDFAQVEDDLQQVNLTRFGLFFPEKREFFLEGQGIFSFGGATGSDTPTMFFSRQIGLFRGAAVPILGGGRLTGKVGNYSIGLIDIQTDESGPAGAPSTNFGVARVRRDIFGKSYVGVLATHRNPSGGRQNTLVGADANLAFGLTSVTAYYARTTTPGLSGKDASYAGALEHNGDRYGLNAQYLAVEENFNPEVGFLRRQNFRTYSASARFSPRPARTHMKAFRKFYYESGIDYTTNTAGRLESRSASGSLRTELENGGEISASVTQDHEVLENSFPIATNVTIPVGEYRFARAAGSYTLPPVYRVRGTFSGNTGEFYDGTRHEARFSGRVEISKQVTVEPTLSLNWIDLRAGAFKTNLISARTTYTLSPRSALGALVQYNSGAHTVSSNIRFRWEYVPGSDLFIVYSEGRTTLLPDRLADLQNRAFVVKITRMFRY